VDTEISRPSYNHPDLLVPHTIDGLFLEEEGTANDHSGVHQCYRWTIRPKVDSGFTDYDVCSSDGAWEVF
jgi:hypothetical protein